MVTQDDIAVGVAALEAAASPYMSEVPGLFLSQARSAEEHLAPVIVRAVIAAVDAHRAAAAAAAAGSKT
jgi:hypothetical protein